MLGGMSHSGIDLDRTSRLVAPKILRESWLASSVADGFRMGAISDGWVFLAKAHGSSHLK